MTHQATPDARAVDGVGVLASVVTIPFAAESGCDAGGGIHACAFRVGDAADAGSALIQTGGGCAAGVGVVSSSDGGAEDAEGEAFATSAEERGWCEGADGGVGVEGVAAAAFRGGC